VANRQAALVKLSPSQPARPGAARRFLNFLMSPLVRREASPDEVVGMPGTAVHQGWVASGEKDPALAGRQRYITFDNMVANCAIVGAGVRYFLNLGSRPSWRAEPADDTPEAREKAELVEEMLDEMQIPLRRAVRRTLTFPFYGFSVQEATYKLKDGDWWIDEIAPRPQHSIERWDVDLHGRVLGCIQRPPLTMEEVYLPRVKMVYAVDDALSDSPEGFGLFRQTVESWRILRRYQQLEGFGFESDLAGVPIGRAPLTKLQKLKDAGKIDDDGIDTLLAPLIDILQNHTRSPRTGWLTDSAVARSEDDSASPSGTYEWALDLIQAAVNSQQYIHVAIQREIKNIALILGVEGLLIGMQETGSYALSEDKSTQLTLVVESALRDVRHVYQRDVVDVLWRLNQWDEDLKPRLKTEMLRPADVEKDARVLESLTRAALDPTDRAIDIIRTRMDLPPAPEVDPLTAGALAGLGVPGVNPLLPSPPPGQPGGPPQPGQPPQPGGQPPSAEGGDDEEEK